MLLNEKPILDSTKYLLYYCCLGCKRYEGMFLLLYYSTSFESYNQ